MNWRVNELSKGLNFIPKEDKEGSWEELIVGGTAHKHKPPWDARIFHFFHHFTPFFSLAFL